GLGLSRRRLAALFQAAYGTTLHGCLGTLRVTEACRLLRETDQPVAQI
ncbi:Maff2 family protein, partial [Dysosmobacter welbionis]